MSRAPGLTMKLRELRLEFPSGLPAFETYTRFRLFQSSLHEQLLFLESEENPEVSFPVVPVALLDPRYELRMACEDCAALGIEDVEGSITDLLCLAIVTACEDMPPSANLAAPVVVHVGRGVAIQAVRFDGVYSHEHRLTAGATCL